MTAEPLGTVADRLSEFVDRVQFENERVTITKDGRPVAVPISVDDLEALEETLSILGDADAMAAIREGEAALASGDAVGGIDAIPALLVQRRHPPTR